MPNIIIKIIKDGCFIIDEYTLSVSNAEPVFSDTVYVKPLFLQQTVKPLFLLLATNSFIFESYM